MAVAYLRALRLLSRDVRLYLASAAASAFAQDGIRGVLLNLYLLRLGYGPRFIGLLGGAGALAFTVFCPAAGALGTRWGSRRVLIVGTSLLVAANGLLPLAESVPVAWQAGWLLATSMLGGVGMALFFVNGIPFLMGATGREERHYAFSMQMALVPLAIFAGSLVGGVLPGVLARAMGASLDDAAPYRYALLLAAVLLTPTAGALLKTRMHKPQTTSVEEHVTGTGAAPLTLIILIGFFAALRFAGQSTAGTFFNVYLDDELGTSTALIGTLRAFAQLMAVPAALATPLVLTRWRKSRVVVAGSLGHTLGQTVLALVARPGAAGLGYAGMMASFSITTATFRIFSQELVSPRWRARMAAALMMGAGLSASAMTFFGGFVITALGYANLFLLGAGLTAGGTVLFWVCFRKGND